MVPVALEEQSKVLFPILSPMLIIDALIGGLGPFINPLIHDHDTDLVAVIIEFRTQGVMRRADGSTPRGS